MLSMSRYMTMVAVCLALAGHTAFANDLRKVELSDSALSKRYFSADVVPHCVITLAAEFKNNACFLGENKKYESAYHELHQHFLANVEALRRDGGEYEKLAKDKYALYHEAICTLGFRESCALREVLGEAYSRKAKSALLYFVSGERYKYLENPLQVYPEDYNPENFEHFKTVVNNGVRKIKSQRNR